MRFTIKVDIDPKTKILRIESTRTMHEWIRQQELYIQAIQFTQPEKVGEIETTFE